MKRKLSFVVIAITTLVAMSPSLLSAAVRNPSLPIASRTPGAIDPRVTHQNLRTTICVSGYSSTVRPPSSYTHALKVRQLHSGYAVGGDFSTSDYEEDHLISLELGGSPTAERNLWPEPYSSVNGARTKDTLENRLHALVCAGIVPLTVAQRAIATNWITAYRVYVG